MSDDLEDRKEQIWNMEEIRGGDTALDDEADTPDTADTPDGPDTGETTLDTDAVEAGDTPDTERTGNTQATQDIADTVSASGSTDAQTPEDTADTQGNPDVADTPDTTSTVDTADTPVLGDTTDNATVRQMYKTAEEQGVTVDDMRNLNVYLFDRVHDEMKDLQAEVNYRAMKQRGDEVQMNKEFFNAIYRVAARHEDEILDELELDP